MQAVSQRAEVVGPRILHFRREPDEGVRGLRRIEVEGEQCNTLTSIEFQRETARRFLALEFVCHGASPSRFAEMIGNCLVRNADKLPRDRGLVSFETQAVTRRANEPSGRRFGRRVSDTVSVCQL